MTPATRPFSAARCSRSSSRPRPRASMPRRPCGQLCGTSRRRCAGRKRRMARTEPNVPRPLVVAPLRSALVSVRSPRGGDISMKIGIPRESRPGERLVSASPATVAQLLKLGYDVVVETGAGAEASYPDTAYVEAGASVAAAEEYGGMFTGQVTAAGKTSPANVFVIGAGVAGLAAIGAANSLGAQVRAFDVRPEVAEEIESMGATFVEAKEAQQEVSKDGYAAALTEEQQQAAMGVYAAETARADVVVSTALVRGKAPTTITAAMVANMRPGSVIVDLGATGGGNCELTVPGKKVVSDNGVVIVGYTDLTSRMPRHTSQLFGTNLVHLMELLTPGKDGELVLDLKDPVQRGMTVAHNGEVLWPPPPVAVSAAPAKAAEVAPAIDPTEKARLAAAEAKRKATRRNISYLIGAVLSIFLLTYSPSETVAHLTVFALAVIVGYYVISNVSHSLHTPLMSQTNAISGVILVGALLQIGSDHAVVAVVAFIAAAIASINIFGGFLVTYRMLGMFRKDV